MFNRIPALFTVLALMAPVVSQATVLPLASAVHPQQAPLYGTYHDRQSDFVFVKLPAGWTFVAKDEGTLSHEVFQDASTGFVFVKLSSGWKFVGAA